MLGRAALGRNALGHPSLPTHPQLENSVRGMLRGMSVSVMFLLALTATIVIGLGA